MAKATITFDGAVTIKGGIIEIYNISEIEVKGGGRRYDLWPFKGIDAPRDEREPGVMDPPISIDEPDETKPVEPPKNDPPKLPDAVTVKFTVDPEDNDQ